jgi:hypothetical protein
MKNLLYILFLLLLILSPSVVWGQEICVSQPLMHERITIDKDVELIHVEKKLIKVQYFIKVFNKKAPVSNLSASSIYVYFKKGDTSVLVLFGSSEDCMQNYAVVPLAFVNKHLIDVQWDVSNLIT